MDTNVGILSAACHMPVNRASLADVFLDEGVALSPHAAEHLGIESVHICREGKGSHLALIAAQEAIQKAGLAVADIGVIVDYSVWPQEFLAPAWNMSNKLQHELGATNAFTVGFSGGGTTHFNVALHFADSLLRSDESVKAALLLGADTAIPHRRILNRLDPVTVFGDGASAVILQRGSAHSAILGSELWSHGEFHDVCTIPGGAMIHPDRIDLYAMTLDVEKYARNPKFDLLRNVCFRLLERVGVRMSDVIFFLYPNLSLHDQSAFMKAFEVGTDRLCLTNRPRYGHVQANDFVLNYLTMVEERRVKEGDHVLMLSHGMGFTYGATLMRY